ncbi:hypothetical protein D1007_00251 [Hordeum vulgare]|nr:hypothetical protein D1007_00251 [Hordeum vulgare]
MKVLCWNIRGFGRPGRRRQLIDFLRQKAIDIVGLQETIRQDFRILELPRLSRHQFAWQWLPASGNSGGILLGVREDAFRVDDMDRGEFFVNMSILDRRTHLSWEVIIIYGSADHARSADFLTELKNKVERCSTPVVVVGDFNLIRWDSDKSSSNVDRGCMCMFNDYIADLALREIARLGARFTWTNKQADPIRRVLDRVFVSPQWVIMFPLSSLKAVTRIGSDHTPLLFLSGDGEAPRSGRFRFETFMLDQMGFCYEGLGANLGADLRARKGVLLDQIQVLDNLADGPGLSPDDWLRRYSLEASLMSIYESEELFWQRRGGQNLLLKGDENTAYFQAIANGRRKKCAISFLWDRETLLESH